jgi:hypothetical protein
MFSKFPLLPAATILVLAIAAVEAACLVRSLVPPAAPTPVAAALPAPQAGLSDSSDPPESADSSTPLSLGRGWPEGPGEGLRPTTPESALAAESALPADSALAPDPADSDPDSASSATSATPAELSPEDLAAQKKADYLRALEIINEHHVQDFFNELELTDDQRHAAAPAAEKIMAAELASDQAIDNFSKGMSQLHPFDFQTASVQKLQQFIDLETQFAAAISEPLAAYETLRPGLDPRQLHRLDAVTKRYKQNTEGTKQFIEFLRKELKERQAANKPAPGSKGP